MKCLLVSMVIAGLWSGTVRGAEQTAPWWKRQKIRFMWGTWPHAIRNAGGTLSYWESDLPREQFRNIAQAGATVFAEVRGYKPKHARFAHEFGLKYFATIHGGYLGKGHGHGVHLAGGRRRISPHPEREFTLCPLDESVYGKWLLHGARGDVPILTGVQDGLIDGIHNDMEVYDRSECYCDDCFTTFLQGRKMEATPPDGLERIAWLEARELTDAYKDNFSERRMAMFTRIRRKLHAVNPRLLFSSCGSVVSDYQRAMNTPEAPFIFLDGRSYFNDDRQPWWESYGRRLKQDGFLYLPGGWANALFGAQASQVSAARWIYETSINMDGNWIWFEHEVHDDMLAAYAAADRRIRHVLDAVGPLLFDGEQDYDFVTAVEWTGRPELERALITRTHRLGDEHLVHVGNVHGAWPLRARIRFPRLPAGGRWTVRDPLSKQHYARGDDRSAIWTSDDLLKGPVVVLEPRSDLFLLVSPAKEDEVSDLDASRLMFSREFDATPGHAAAAASAGAVKGMLFTLPAGGWQFRMDEEDVGVEKKWFLATAPLEGWAPIEIGRFWGDQGDEGVGWYRADVEFPPLPADRPIQLHFGAVDEELMLWIDGQFAGEHNQGPGGWNKPFVLDVTDKLSGGKHHVAMRVRNTAKAGGVWKPVSLVSGPPAAGSADRAGAPGGDVAPDGAPGAGAAGRIAYTATERLANEQMAFRQVSGALIIRNAIFAAGVDGANQMRIRQLHGHLWSPRYSPDGTRIAFVHDAGGRGQIHVMGADGSEAVNLSDNAFCDRAPVWSPDGARIAFVSDREGDWDIYVMDADGSGQTRLAGNRGVDRAPAWSPDGRRLAWESHVSGLPNVWVCDADGRNSRAFVGPDKRLKIEGLERAPDEGVNIRNVEFYFGPSRVFPDNALHLTDPVWSPDGQRIAAVLVAYGTGCMVAILDPDGTRILGIIEWIAGPGNLAWSPDGTLLAGTMRTAPQESERAGIFVVRTDATEIYRWLVDVKPQGPRLGGAQRTGLHTWYLHGSALPSRVVKTFASLAWSPDSRMLAFTADMHPSGAFHVYTIRPNEEEAKPQRIDSSRSAWPNQIAWRPD